MLLPLLETCILVAYFTCLLVVVAGRLSRSHAASREALRKMHEENAGIRQESLRSLARTREEMDAVQQSREEHRQRLDENRQRLDENSQRLDEMVRLQRQQVSLMQELLETLRSASHP